ncbi:DUF7573 domain-containing protein [Haladaptatus sp. NG-SE-30]
MSEETSLSDFGPTDADEKGDEGVDTEASEERKESYSDEEKSHGDETGSHDDEEEVEPARATYDWTPDGATCAGCGESVERRWRDDDGMVCADCKEW